MDVDFVLPDLGEGVESGTIAKVMVTVGDPLTIDQPIMELETEKAVFEVPSSVEGIIKEIFVKERDEVMVGQKILTVTSAETVQKEPAKAKNVETSSTKEETGEASAGETKATPVDDVAQPAGELLQTSGVTTPAASTGPEKPDTAAPAAPSVRRFAREIGIDINTVKGSGPGGRISVEDVKRHAKTLNEQRPAAHAGTPGRAPKPLPDFSRWGKVESEPMSQVRKKTAEHLADAWSTIAQVTHFDKADITNIEQLRIEHKGKAKTAGGVLTLTAMLVKISAAALKVFPQFNASIDMANKSIIYKKYHHIGFAVDTERGLLVPVIRDVDCKSLIDVSVELTRLAKKARDKTITIDEMQGGCFTITNLGGIGGTAFTPIVNTPEVAILGVSRSRMEAMFIDDRIEPRLMVPLTLSYDHRLIDGADAARFLRWIVEAIEEPFRVLLGG